MSQRNCHPPGKNRHPTHRKDAIDEPPIYVTSHPPLSYLLMILTLPMHTALTQLLYSETRSDFPAPNPQGITQTPPAPSAPPHCSPPGIAPQSPLHHRPLGYPTLKMLCLLPWHLPFCPQDSYLSFTWGMEGMEDVSQGKVVSDYGQ